MPVPTDWSTSNDTSLVRENAVDGSVKIVTITNRGADLGTANQTYTGVPIKGDGTGATCTVTIDGDSKISEVSVSAQGSGYTFGTLDFELLEFQLERLDQLLTLSSHQVVMVPTSTENWCI